MADNIAIATGSAGGSGSIATDQLATGEHVQFMKLMDGTLDSTNKAVVNASGQLSVIQSTSLPAGSNLIGVMRNQSAIAAGTILNALNAAQTITLNGLQSVFVNLTVNGTMTIIYEVSTDNSTWSNATGITSTGGLTGGGTTSGMVKVDTSAYNFFRVRVSSYTSGSATAVITAAPGVLAAITEQLPAGTNMIGNVTGSILSIINPLPAGTNMIGNVTSSCLAIINPLPAGTNKIGTVDIATAVATAKGTQGANALPVQDLKDAGRTSRTFILDSFAVAVATEALMTLSGSAGFAAPVANTAFSASAGKTLRIQSIAANIHTIAGNTTAVNVIIRIRAQSGTAIVTSPVQWITSIQGVAAANSAGVPVDLSFPDGWELPSSVSFGITTTCAGFVATTAAPKVDITLTAYEY